MSKLPVFISWSGPLAKEVAVELRRWLPSVLQHTAPWCSNDDIQSGARWSTEVAQQLSTTDFGVIVVTPDNVNAPWLNFEAGALAKRLDAARVVPTLVGLGPTEIAGPLSQFQMEQYTAEGVWSLVNSINSASNENKLDISVLQTTFDSMIGSLMLAFEPSGQAQQDPTSSFQRRTDRELLEEMVLRLRNVTFDTDVDSRSIYENDDDQDEELEESAPITPPNPVPGLKAGDQVVHKKWGNGKVLSVTGPEDRLEGVFHFASVGQKTLMVNWAPIVRA